MINWVKKNKLHCLAIITVTILFVLSIFVRSDQLKRELSAEKEWITAHSLITFEIWNENGGPSAYNFAPIYTYPGPGNKDIAALGGVSDEALNLYYVSYPPGTFVIGYYFTKMLGGPSLDSIRIFGLLIHYICALLIYLIVRKLSSFKHDRIQWAGLIAVVFYLFSAGHLWIHGFLFFSDILVQPLVLGLFLLLIQPIRTKALSKKRLIAIVALVFLGCWTEWLMLFFAFVTGLYFLWIYFRKKEKIFLIAFLAVGFTAAFALFITVVHYSTIGGFDQFIEVSMNKYQERSGATGQTIGSSDFNISNPKSYELLMGHFKNHYWMLINCVTIILIGFVLAALLQLKWKILSFKSTHWTVLVLLSVALLMHLVVFFNFNALHDFAKLKLGTWLILLIAGLLVMIESSSNKWLRWVFLGATSVLIIIRLPIEIDRFHTQSEESWFAHFYKDAAIEMREHSGPDDLVFLNIPYLQPEFIYRSKHNSYKVPDVSQALNILKSQSVKTGHFYEFDKVKLMMAYEIKVEDDKLLIGDTLFVTGN